MLAIARKFIAGYHAADAIEKAKQLNEKGISTTIDILLDRPKSMKDAADNANQYISLSRLIKKSGVDADVAVKLSQLGLHIDEELCEENVLKIANVIKVTIDMEEHAHRRKILETFLRAHRRRKNVMIAVQAYLHSSAEDVRILLREKASIRLVKGVYMESPYVAYQKKEHIRDNFTRIAKMLIKSGRFHAFGTHDEEIIETIKKYARNRRNFEFQTLYGVKSWIPQELAAEGYRARVYIPYGRKWLGYVIRRQREAKR